MTVAINIPLLLASRSGPLSITDCFVGAERLPRNDEGRELAFVVGDHVDTTDMTLGVRERRL